MKCNILQHKCCEFSVFKGPNIFCTSVMSWFCFPASFLQLLIILLQLEKKGEGGGTAHFHLKKREKVTNSGERARKHGILKEKHRQMIFGSFHPTPTTFTKNQMHPTRHSFTNWVLTHAASTLLSCRTVSGLFTAFLNCSTCNLTRTVVGFLTFLLQKKELQQVCSLTEIAHSYK